MKVIGIIGSPRKHSNTDILVRKVLAGAAAEGAETKAYYLQFMDIKGCLGCEFCRVNEGCAQSDDMQTLYAEIESADVVVIGSPVYMEQITGQTKIFMDRLLAFLNNDFSSRLKPGKRAILVFTQGQGDVDTYADYFKTTAKMFGILGLPVVHTIVAPNLLEHAAVVNDEGLLTKAALVGLQL